MEGKVSLGEAVIISLLAAGGLIFLSDMTRPKGARMFNKGPSGETDLMWNSATIPPKAG